MYPKGKVTPSGISDRLLSDYPNMLATCRPAPGITRSSAMKPTQSISTAPGQVDLRSDCNDLIGRGPSCIGARTIESFAVSSGSKIQDKLFSGNACRIIRIPK